MNNCGVKTEERLEYRQLLDEFLLGCKTEEKIGMEYERIPVYKADNSVVPYEGVYGICEVLREFAKKDNWDYILDDNNIIGLKKLHDTITLEPGCQFELSIEPQDTVKELKNALKKLIQIYSPF